MEHGIGLWGDEWKVGEETKQAVPYWTDPTHTYEGNEMVSAAMQYVCVEDDTGFRCENPIMLHKGGCDVMSHFSLAIEEIE